MRKLLTLLAILALAAPLAFYGCSGSDGANGLNGVNGTNGTNGTPGTTGPSGAAAIADKHGADVASVEELEGSLPATVVITGATANAAGVATVTFTVKNAAGASVTGLGTKDQAASLAIASLEPAAAPFSYNRWVSYIWRVSDGVNQAYRVRPGVGGLVEGPAGTYTYTFVQNLGTVKRPADNVAITYDRTRTHRVFVALRGTSSGFVGGNTFDFVPAGGAISQTRDIVEDATCRKCHMNTPGHYGPWNGIVKACVICHSPGNTLANAAPAPAYDSGAAKTLEMSVMLHRIHAGRELATVAGPDGQFYDNPNTAVDETADNGPLYLLGSTPRSWNTAAFPPVLANCQACHTQAVAGSLAQVDNWKTVPSRAACGSCHDNINFATGANHSSLALVQTNDGSCASCHPGAGSALAVTDAHNWTVKDIRNIPEFDVALTVNTPARGYFINGEKPVISIALKDKVTGAVILPSTVIQDNLVNIPNPTNATGEGCLPDATGTACTVPRDTLFSAASVYVTGPRGQRVPVLSYAARAKVTSTSAGPWNLTGAGNTAIRVKVDGGMSMLSFNNAIAYEGYGADEWISGDITVTRSFTAADNAFFANQTAATPAEVANWLNANTAFHERAIAYVDEARPGATNAGRLSIRSRGVLAKNINGEVTKTAAQRNVLVVTSPTGMFTANQFGVSGTSASVRIMNNFANTDPMADFSDPTAIKYALDNVDDLAPGTYGINVEYADAGRAPAPLNPAEPPYTNYRAPSVAVATFQVKQADAEKPVADGCTACHWSSAGTGFVLDPPRHNKLFNDNAVDQCGGCHEYHSGQNSATATQVDTFSGGHPLSKRVHAVHYGSNLNYPTITVAHEETAAFGRNWNITYPMNILNCESCHSKAGTSGTWKTNPNRIACMGCHDSDAATAHMDINTHDPTPLAPWSGDEQESCKTCH